MWEQWYEVVLLETKVRDKACMWEDTLSEVSMHEKTRG